MTFKRHIWHNKLSLPRVAEHSGHRLHCLPKVQSCPCIYSGGFLWSLDKSFPETGSILYWTWCLMSQRKHGAQWCHAWLNWHHPHCPQAKVHLQVSVMLNTGNVPLLTVQADVHVNDACVGNVYTTAAYGPKLNRTLALGFVFIKKKWIFMPYAKRYLAYYYLRDVK